MAYNANQETNHAEQKGGVMNELLYDFFGPLGGMIVMTGFCGLLTYGFLWAYDKLHGRDTNENVDD